MGSRDFIYRENTLLEEMLRDVKDDITGASWIDLLGEVHRAPTCMEKIKQQDRRTVQKKATAVDSILPVRCRALPTTKPYDSLSTLGKTK